MICCDVEEEAAGEAAAEDGADDDLKTRTPHNDVGKNGSDALVWCSAK